MSNRPQPADASDALMTELATIPNHLGFVVFDHAGKKLAASGELEGANPLTFLNMIRDAHALVGCSEKKQELKRVLVTFDDKEYVWFASYLLLHFCNTLRMYVVIQSQSKITVLLKGSK